MVKQMKTYRQDDTNQKRWKTSQKGHHTSETRQNNSDTYTKSSDDHSRYYSQPSLLAFFRDMLLKRDYLRLGFTKVVRVGWRSQSRWPTGCPGIVMSRERWPIATFGKTNLACFRCTRLKRYSSPPLKEEKRNGCREGDILSIPSIVRLSCIVRCFKHKGMHGAETGQ